MTLRMVRGMVLVTTLFVTLVIAMLILTAVKLSSGTLRAVSQIDQRELALWAANSGLEYAQTRLQADFSWQGNLGKGAVTAVNQPGTLVVREDNGNVIGVLMREDGGVAQFLIRFNPQDGTDDPFYLIKNPHLCVNNLHSDLARPVYLGNGTGWAISSQSNHDCPGRTAAIIVEGRAGAGISSDPSAPDAPGAVSVSRVAEAYFSPDGSVSLPGLLFGGGDIDFIGEGGKGVKVKMNSLEAGQAKVVAGFGVNADSGSGSIESKTGAILSVNSSGGHAAAANLSKNINVTDNGGTLNFPDIEWETLPHADGSKTQIPAGLYVWREGPGGDALYYYDLSYDEYASSSDPTDYLPAVNEADKVNPDFSGLSGAHGSGLSYDSSGRITVSEDVLVEATSSTNTIAIISEDDGNAGRTLNFSPPEGESSVLTNPSGSVVIDSTVRGAGGAITSADRIELTGAGYDLYNEPSAETGVSLYAKGDIFLQTFEAPAGTPKGSTKGKDGKGNPEVKSGAPGKFLDMKLTGVIYTWGDFTADLGGGAKLEMKGSLVAYGSDPSVGPPTPGQGHITMSANDVNLVYDSRYLVTLMQSGSGALKRTMWVIY